MTATIVVGCIGTSIARGVNNATTSESYWMKACIAASVPHVSVAMSGENTTFFNATGGHEMRSALLGTCTDILVEHGVNDIIRGSQNTLAVVGGRLLTLYALANGINGARIWSLTLPPSYNNSTDSWLTVANQTANAALQNYIDVNNWIRAGCPQIAGVPKTPGTVGATSPTGWAGYFDIADAMMTARDSGIWKADGTTAGQWSLDGVHPTEYAHTQAASVVNINTIRAAAAVPFPIRNLVKVGGVPALIH